MKTNQHHTLKRKDSAFKVLGILSSLALLLAGCGHLETVNNSDGRYTGKGDSYFLPATEVVVAVPVSMRVTKLGDIAIYGPPLLGVEEMKNKDYPKYGFSVDAGGITTEFVGIQDESLEYVVRDRKNPMVTRSRTMKWNSEGVLTSGDATVNNRTVEFVVNTIEGAAKIAASGAKFASAASKEPTKRRGLVQLAEKLKLSEDDLKYGIDILMGEGIALAQPIPDEPVGWKAFVGSADFWELKSSTDAAKQYRTLTSAISLAQSAEAINALKKEARDILSRFTTATTEASWTGRFHWLPRKRKAGETNGRICESVQLFVYSEDEGPQTIYSRSESTPPIKQLRKPGTKGGATKSVVISLTSEIPASAADWDDLRSRPGRKGWHYIIPAKSKLAVRVGNSTKATKSVQIAQHGVVAFTPSTTGGQKVTANLKVDPVSGARTEMTLGGDSFDPALIKRTADAAAMVIEADPALQNLKRRKEMLQLKKDISGLEADPAAQ